MARLLFFAIAASFCLSRLAIAGNEGEILFADDFATLNPGWGEADQQFLGVEDGKLVIEPGNDRYRSLPYQTQTFGDVDLRVKLAQTSGELPGSAGIAFWGSRETGEVYFARMQSNGFFTVERRLPNGRLLAPVLLKRNDSVKTDPGAVNELQVTTRGKTATVYINGKQAASLEGMPPEGGSQIGLLARSPAVRCRWEFSDFVVRKAQ